MIRTEPIDAPIGSLATGWDPGVPLSDDGHEEAFALTQAAMDHAIVAEHTYTHRWQQGDVVIFDTVGTVHRREMPHSPGPRSLRQLSIKYP